jgi:hypothetical protein
MEIEMVYVPDHVENAAAYIKAAENRIAANRVMGGRKRFLEANADGLELINFIEVKVSDAQLSYFAQCGQKLPSASFIDACWYGLHVFGGLTENQAAAVRRSIAKQAERAAEFKARDAASQHIGAVGERRIFDLAVSFVTSFESQFGIVLVYGFRDADGNVVIYKGSSCINNQQGEPAEKGDQIILKATIKEHGERDGVKQTIISRPKQ